MSKIPRSHFSTSMRSTTMIASTPLGVSKKIPGNMKVETSKLKFSDSAELSLIEKNTSNERVSDIILKNETLKCSENNPLKRSATSMPHNPKKQPKLVGKPSISSAKIAPYDFKAKYNDIFEKYKELQKDYSDLQEKYSDGSEELMDVKSRLEIALSEKSCVSKKLEKLSCDNSRMISEIDDIVKQQEMYKTKNSELEKTIVDQNKQISDNLKDKCEISSQLLEAKSKLMYKTNEYESLKMMLDNEIKKSVELSSIVEENQIKLSYSTSEITFLKTRQTIMEQKNNEVTASIADLKQENEQLKEQMAKIHNENQKLQTELDKQNTECNKVSGLFNLELEKNITMKSNIDLCQSQIALYINDLGNSKNANELLRKTVEEGIEEKQRLRTKIQELEKEVVLMHDNQKILRNNIQDLKGHIRVYCRVRPLLATETNKPSLNVDIVDSCTMDVEKVTGQNNSGLTKKQNSKHSFAFDGIFSPNSTQNEIFQEVSSLVQSALDGYNVCIFAYGQTGSGKTYTMEGDLQQNETGIIPRAVDMIFENVPKLQKMGWEFNISAAFLEIYNENIYDLLDTNKDQEDHSIKMVDSKGNDVYVSNLREETVRDSNELLKLLSISQKNRQTAATLCNERSSRSHSVTKIKICAVHEARKEKYVSSLNLVDLAGSESGKTTQRMEETKSINKSLSELSKVILALQSKQNHIPYRNSKLTYLLMPCLGGNSKTLMLVNVCQFDECYQETINSLRFAAKVNSCRTGAVKKNISTL